METNYKWIIEDCKPECCKYCADTNLNKLGFVTIVGGKKLQRYKCQTCGRTFTRL
ncbi:MAG: hypothetical protein RBQ97_04450 [Acholeplasma sp.]|nr:hypothetical protein [Acholeplasma sp.]